MKTLLLLGLISFNLNASAQIWKFRSTVNKIDSLEEVINRDRELYNNELIQSHSLTNRLSDKINSLKLELARMEHTIDSLAFAAKNTVKTDSALTTNPTTNAQSTFCPDNIILEQVKYLENCCCLIDQGCPNKTSAGGLRIVKEGYQMAIIREDIITGSCWDFINKV